MWPAVVTRRRASLSGVIAFCVACLSAPAWAQDFSLSGLADLRLVAPSGQISHADGSYGRFRWGDGRGSPILPEVGQMVLRGSASLSPDLRVVAEFRYDPSQKTALDIIDATIRYRPVSTSRWRWSLKGGAFFPPVSLENTQIGWTPEWTITPSAINSWVGEELRIFGAEAALEWRGDVDRFEFLASAFGLNEPAGAGIASYGWSFSDKPTGMLDHLRLVGSPRVFSDEFRHFDHAIGWYAGLSWERPDIGRLSLLRYDNEADPHASDRSQTGWRTEFWSLGFSTEIGPVTILSQAMTGSTLIAPSPYYRSTTNFWAVYVLAGIERGDWRYAIRYDRFGTSEVAAEPWPKGDENGQAGTASVIWTPRKYMSLASEVMAVDYNRPQRVLLGRSAHVTEVQAQLALRLKF